MAKAGIYHDYDLRANEHIKDEPVCVVCDEPLMCRWTDYHGEGACVRCGTPYQLLQYDENNKQLDLPPRCNIREDFIPHMRRYWAETHRVMDLGRYMGGPPDRAAYNAFADWVERNVPREQEAAR